MMSISCYALEQERLTEIKSESSEINSAVFLSIEELKKRGYKPNKFFVSIEEKEHSILLHISHEDDFKPENANVSGNPSGKSQLCTYNKTYKELNSCLYYQ